MQVNEKTLAWGKEKLSQFKEWRDFPKSADGLRFRVELFVKMVQNKTAEEIISVRSRSWDPEANPCEIGNSTNDADWLLGVVAQTCDRFPSHAAMRRLYEQYFTLDDARVIEAARVIVDGDVW